MFLIRFRWVYCQLERLRRCLVSSVRRILDELPETLDETYTRILEEIPQENQEHAHRLLQCLTVACRPLRVKELAEVLAIDFTAVGTPRLNVDLRWEDQEEAILLTCSSLVMVIDDHGSRVVQFSHYSVKEFLISDRLAALQATSRYYVQPEAAHTVMSQACLATLLRLEHHPNEESTDCFPLADYAAIDFANHAEFGNVISHIRDGVDTLLDVEKPHFKTWLFALGVISLWASDKHLKRPEAAALYFVARLGFLGMVRHLISKCPQDVHVRIGYNDNRTPLHAAAEMGHLEVTKLLLRHRADMDIRDRDNRTPLHLASATGHLDTVQLLLDPHADGNSRRKKGATPLHQTVILKQAKLARMLLVRNTGIRARDKDGRTPLHLASEHGCHDVVRLLLDRGADVNVQDEYHRTPLHLAIDASFRMDPNKTVCVLLLESRINVDIRDREGNTPLHYAVKQRRDDIARLLLDRGADVDAQNKEHSTPLHMVSDDPGPRDYEAIKATCTSLLDTGANLNIRDYNGQTPLHLATSCKSYDIVRLLLDRGADVDLKDKFHYTPLRMAVSDGDSMLTQLLLESGANVYAQGEGGITPHQIALVMQRPQIIQLLFDHTDCDSSESSTNVFF
jgi:ankyrin repeat protein